MPKSWRFGNLWTIGHHRRTLINRRDDSVFLFRCLNAPLPARTLVGQSHSTCGYSCHTRRLAAAHLGFLMMMMMKIHVIPIGWWERDLYFPTALPYDDSWWRSLLVVAVEIVRCTLGVYGTSGSHCCRFINTWSSILSNGTSQALIERERERNKTPRFNIYVVDCTWYSTFQHAADCIFTPFTCCIPSTYFILRK